MRIPAAHQIPWEKAYGINGRKEYLGDTINQAIGSTCAVAA